MASEAADFAGAAWKAYSTAPSFTLSAGDGLKMVYFKVRNAASASAVANDTIVLAEMPVVTSFAINNGAWSTTSQTVRLDNACTGSPTDYMASEAADFAGAAWEAYSTAPSFTLSASEGPKTVYFKVRNAASASAIANDTIVLAEPSAGMELIPAGEFQMGDSLDEGATDERPVHAVYVDAFFMDRYEVTNQQYADALNWANGQGNLLIVAYGGVYAYGGGYPYCSTTAGSPYSRITWNGSAFGVTPGKENHPMVMVSWYGAVAYANWRSAMEGRPLSYDLSAWNCSFNSGYRLPTEAEWEKAYRGGNADHRFPWSDSDDIQHARANYYSSSNFMYDNSSTRGDHPLWGVGGEPWTSPAGFFDGSLHYRTDFSWPGTATSYQTVDGVNGYGLYDMAGNVWEWCNDWYSATYYQWCVDNCGRPCANPHGPATGAPSPVLRGGCWACDASRCRAAARGGIGDGRSSRSPCNGFRLVLRWE
jgi:formylglycine-generating enzyme required for sulfatase activity